MSHRRADSTRRKNMSRLQLEPLERREVLSSLPVPAPLPVPASLTSQYQLVATIRLPGNPLTSFDISYVDSTTHRLYFADRSNAGVDIIDTRTNTFLGRVGGFVGLPPGGKELGGPNGVVAVGNNEVWASDGDSTIKVIKLNANRTGGKVVQTISTGGKDRVDEVAYDPRDHLVAAVNNNDSPPFVSLISTNPNNRHIVAQLSITNATGGLEQPLWDRGLGKFLVSVPELNGYSSYNAIAEIDPRTFTVTYLPLNGLQPSGLVLGPKQELLVSNNDGGIAAGLPARSEIISAFDGHVIATIPQVAGADEEWYNPGDNHYYEAALAQPGGGVLGIIDAKTHAWIQNVPTSSGSQSVAADSSNNAIFVALPASASDPQGGIGVYQAVLHG